MADTAKKPRIRKSAPTIRQQAVTAQAKAANAKPNRLKSAVGSAAGRLPKGKFKLPKPVNKILRPIAKPLAWLAPTYFINAWREVRQVVWPNRKETWRLTLAVFVFAVVFGALIAGVDKGLDEVFKKFVLK